jgi:hypothetical protein
MDADVVIRKMYSTQYFPTYPEEVTWIYLAEIAEEAGILALLRR